MTYYQPRFVRPEHVAELVNLYHLARTALAGSNEANSKYARRVWAARAFHGEHPEVSATAAYKDLEGLLAWD